MKKYLPYLFVVFIAFTFIVIPSYNDSNKQTIITNNLDKNGYYTNVNDVAAYINEYNKLPNNYITKNVAKDLGWLPSENNLWQVSHKKSIGGDKFYNREKLLPQKTGRIYYEADIDYNGKKRNAKRVVFSNDGLIFYTKDHYDTFTKLYGDD